MKTDKFNYHVTDLITFNCKFDGSVSSKLVKSAKSTFSPAGCSSGCVAVLCGVA